MLTRLEFHLDQCKQFWKIIWASDKRLVPKFLNFFEKECRVQACEAMLSDYQGVYKQIITGSESWIYAYDPETNDQSSEYRLKGEAKKTSPKSFENQGDADSFLWLSWCKIQELLAHNSGLFLRIASSKWLITLK